MIYNYFPVKIRDIVKKSLEVCDNIEEIRIRSGQNIVFCGSDSKWFIDNTGQFTGDKKNGLKLFKDDLKEMIKYFTLNSVYAMQQDIKNGFITLTDGTRVGLCGRCVIKDGEIENITNISSFNIRMSRQVDGWGNKTFDEIGPESQNTLIIAPPGYGKTTLLRNMIKYASDYGKNVSVIDERCEISPVSEGDRVYDLGVNTDVLSDTSKIIGVNIMLRTMNPEIIAVDEILTKEDFQMLRNTALSGVKIFATFHGKSKNDYERKANAFIGNEHIFDNYIIISKNEKNNRVIKYELQEGL